MKRALLALAAALACAAAAPQKKEPAKPTVKPEVKPTAEPVPKRGFYIVTHIPEEIKYEDCESKTCPLNDQEASYIAYQMLRRTGGLHALLNARTIRHLFNFDVKYRLADKVAAAKTRKEVLDLEVGLLASLHSPLLARVLSLAEADFVAQTVQRNVQECVQLSTSLVEDMWAGYVYQVVDFKRTPTDGISDFMVNLVLFLGAMDTPKTHPDPLAFIKFLETRFKALKENKCTKVDSPTKVPPLTVQPKLRLVVKLVTFTDDGKTKVTDVELDKDGEPVPTTGPKPDPTPTVKPKTG